MGVRMPERESVAERGRRWIVPPRLRTLADEGEERWDLESVADALLGTVAVASVWWLYFDRQASIVPRGGTPAVVVYSYAHLPLLMGLAGASAGLALLVEHADDDRVAVGHGSAYVGGLALFLASLVLMQFVTVTGPHRVGGALRLGAAALLLALAAIHGVLLRVLLAAAVAAILTALVVAERALVPPAPGG